MTWLNAGCGKRRITNDLHRPGARSLTIAYFSLLLVSATLTSAQALATDLSLETKLRPAEVQEGDNFGAALGLEGDTLVVVAPWTEIDGIERSGAVYVYRRDPESGEWLEHQRLMPDEGNYDSIRMSIAIDADTIVVGAYYASLVEFQEGAVYIFERDPNNDTWHQVKKLTDISVGFGGHFGIGVAIEGDLLAVGADMQSTTTDGKVTLFERHHGGANNWGELTVIDGSVVDDGGILEAFGSAVAIHGDLLLVGADRADVSAVAENDGAAYLFRRNEVDRDQWDYQTRLIAPGSDDCVGGQTLTDFFADPESDRAEADRCRREDSRSDHDHFGDAVSFDGNTIVIGAFAAEGNDGSSLVGAAYTFEQDEADADQWTVVTKLEPDSVDATRYFGRNVAVHEDTILVAATGNGGAVHVFERGDEGGWQATGVLTAQGFSDANFGEGLDFDGTKVAVGANGEDVFRGAAYIFVKEDAATGPAADWQPPFAITDELIDNGVVGHDSGLDIRADAGSLLEPLPIWIHEVPTPSPSLPPDVKVHGSFFNIGAIRTKFMEQDKPLTVSFPVPDDAKNEHLGIAVLTAGNSFLSEPPPSLIIWEPISGHYDSVVDQFSFQLRALSAFGTTVALIEHPFFGPQTSDDELVASERIEAIVRKGAPNATTESGADIDIYVACNAFDPCTDAPKEQMDQEVATLKGYALEEFGRYRRLGYEKLHLREEEINGVFTYGPVFWSYIPCSERPSQYIPHTQYIHICKGEVGDYRRTMAHELFHAVQHSFSGFRANLETLSNNLLLKNPDSSALFEPDEDTQFELGRDTTWISEGTARAAENSAEEMVRAGQMGRQLLNRSLKSYQDRSEPLSEQEKSAYKAQDFWVYFGKKRSLGLDYLSGFFTAGATTAAVAEHIADEYGTTLGDEYWEFAKNQFTENATDISIESDSARPPNCKAYLGLVGSEGLRDESTGRYVIDPETKRAIQVPEYRFDYPAETTKTVERLWDLSSNVVEITFTEDINTTLQVAGEPSQGGVGKHKVYLDRAPDTENNQCRQVSDGDRTIGTDETGPIRAGDKVYVLVSNLHFDRNEPINYKVTVSPPG